ncbi:MAG: glutamyl-tRNA synthetase, partial [Sphaerochaeta sp.]|nr:glutamyl-tRNA synthetase [Sphaerochaeta sp.]
KAPGIFDYKKLDWFNGQYIRQKGDEELMELLLPYLERAGFVTLPLQEQEKRDMLTLTAVSKERLKVLSDIVDLSRFLFETPTYEDVHLFAAKKVDLATATLALERAYDKLKEGFAAGKEQEEIEGELASLAEAMEIKVNGVFMPLRVAITGSTVSLPLFDSIKLLGQEETYKRIETALDVLKREV